MTRKPLPFVQTKVLRDGSLRHRGYSERPRVYGKWLDDEDAAYQAAMRMRGEARNTTAADSLDEACENLLDELRLKRTKGTVRWYADHLRAVRRLIPGEVGLCTITPAQLEQFVIDRLQPRKSGLRAKPATVNADLRALHRVFALAIRRGVVRENPVRLVDRPREDAPAMDWFTDAEFRAGLGKIAEQRTRDVMALFALTGIRRSECDRFTPGHVRLNLGQVVIAGKTRTRIVPIAKDLVAPLKRLLAAPKGDRLVGNTHDIDDLFRAAKDAVGDRRWHAHAMRHTFCTSLIRAGVRLDVVMRLAGHRSIKTTMRYAHEVGQEGVDAVGLLRLVPPDESARVERE